MALVAVDLAMGRFIPGLKGSFHDMAGITKIGVVFDEIVGAVPSPASCGRKENDNAKNEPFIIFHPCPKETDLLQE